MAGRPKKDAARFEGADIADARDGLQRLQGEDATTGQFSVEHCAMMLKFWSALFLDAERRMREPGGNRVQAVADLRLASQEAGEWEKRKAGAMSSRKVDLLLEVLAKLKEQEELSDELLDIEE